SYPCVLESTQFHQVIEEPACFPRRESQQILLHLVCYVPHTKIHPTRSSQLAHNPGKFCELSSFLPHLLFLLLLLPAQPHEKYDFPCSYFVHETQGSFLLYFRIQNKYVKHTNSFRSQQFPIISLLSFI